MKLLKEERWELIRHRLDQSRECADEVAFLINNGKYKTAINRIYYGIFYSLLALGLKHGFETSKHLQLLGWFNNTFIRSGKLDIEFGKVVNKSYALRQESDYEPFVKYEEQQLIGLYEKMKEVINAVEKLILEDKPD